MKSANFTVEPGPAPPQRTSPTMELAGLPSGRENAAVFKTSIPENCPGEFPNQGRHLFCLSLFYGENTPWRLRRSIKYAHRMIMFQLRSAVIGLAFCGAVYAASPVYPVKISASGRYLVDQNNVPFLMVGDSPHTLVANLTYGGRRVLSGRPRDEQLQRALGGGVVQHLCGRAGGWQSVGRDPAVHRQCIRAPPTTI